MTETALDLDLDALAPQPLRVRLAGREWLLPGGATTQTVVEIAALFDQFDKSVQADDSERTREISADIRDEFAALFAVHQPEEVEAGELPDLNDEQLAALFGLLVQQVTGKTLPELTAEMNGATSGEGDAPRPTSPKATARPKSSRRSPATSRRRSRASASAS